MSVTSSSFSCSSRVGQTMQSEELEYQKPLQGGQTPTSHLQPSPASLSVDGITQMSFSLFAALQAATDCTPAADADHPPAVLVAQDLGVRECSVRLSSLRYSRLVALERARDARGRCFVVVDDYGISTPFSGRARAFNLARVCSFRFVDTRVPARITLSSLTMAHKGAVHADRWSLLAAAPYCAGIQVRSSSSCALVYA